MPPSQYWLFEPRVETHSEGEVWVEEGGKGWPEGRKEGAMG